RQPGDRTRWDLVRSATDRQLDGLAFRLHHGRPAPVDQPCRLTDAGQRPPGAPRGPGVHLTDTPAGGDETDGHPSGPAIARSSSRIERGAIRARILAPSGNCPNAAWPTSKVQARWPSSRARHQYVTVLLFSPLSDSSSIQRAITCPTKVTSAGRASQRPTARTPATPRATLPASSPAGSSIQPGDMCSAR